MKERKRRILWTLLSIEVLTLWGMDPFENLEENRDPQAQNKQKPFIKVVQWKSLETYLWLRRQDSRF